jgi:hypothetical protein
VDGVVGAVGVAVEEGHGGQGRIPRILSLANDSLEPIRTHQLAIYHKHRCQLVRYLIRHRGIFTDNAIAAATPLPSPAAGLALSHVAIGRGRQNYTCDLTNSTAIPVAIGAVATLFNVSCIAADSPDLLAKLPGIALDLPVPSTTDENSPSYQDMSGHHYFLDATTPFFNLDTTLHQYGTGAFKKANATNAPPNAPLGQFNQGNGSVPWLKLDAKDSTGQIFQEVYRVNTAGGNPPKQCTGMPAAFEVEYAAEYWLFAR